MIYIITINYIKNWIIKESKYYYSNILKMATSINNKNAPAKIIGIQLCLFFTMKFNNFFNSVMYTCAVTWQQAIFCLFFQWKINGLLFAPWAVVATLRRVCFFRRRRRHAYEVSWRHRAGSGDWENPGLAGANGMPGCPWWLALLGVTPSRSKRIGPV